MSHQRFRQSQETKRNLEKFIKAIHEKTIENQNKDVREYGAAHFNVSDQRVSLDQNDAFQTIYNSSTTAQRLEGARPADDLSKNGKSVNVKLGFDLGKSRQLEEAEKLLKASTLAAATSIEATRERLRSVNRNRLLNRQSNLAFSQALDAKPEDHFKSVQNESLNQTRENLKSQDS